MSAVEASIRKRNDDLLVAANGTAIPTYGPKTVSLQIGATRYTWPFILARVAQPIIGADFLRQSGLLVDVRNRRLVRASTGEAINVVASNIKPNPITLVQEGDEFTRWLQQSYPALLKPTFRDSTVKHGVVLQIPTKGRPVFARARRLPPDKLKVAKAAFEEMTDSGVVRRSNSDWASPLHLVPKADGSWRPCGDFRRLNDITIADQYPVPHIQDFSAQLAGCRVFSKVDLVRGYHQIPVASEDVHKTAVITPFGLYEFLRTPFGLKNAAQAFQRLMDSVCRGLTFVFVYLDDILVASRTASEHREHLKTLFTRLQDHGLVINLAKCLFGQTELRFLGHLVSADGISPAPDNVKAIREFPLPKTIQKLMEFNGMVNFYHRFLPQAAHLMSPLYDAVANCGSSKPSRNRPVDWTPERIKAFNAAKETLSRATNLNYFVAGAPLALTTDASDFAVGAVLEQRVAGVWQPLGFFSSRFRPSQAELRRPLALADHLKSATDRELLAAYRAVRHFRHLLEGRPFTLFTDHKPLVGMMSKASDSWSATQARHLAAVAEFTTDVRHLSGKSNIVADTLSRVEIDAVTLGIDPAELAAAQREDPEHIAVRTAITGLNITEQTNGGVILLGDDTQGNFRPWIPATLRRRMYDLHHDLSHPGVKASVRLLTQRCVWYNMKKDITRWARQCEYCQRSKVQRHTKPPLERIPMPNGRFRHVHVDLVGPLPPSDGHAYILTAVDRFTRWPEAFPLRSIDALSVAQAFNMGWVSRFGVPEIITSDRGPQFVSSVWTELARTLGVDVRHTAAYHPQSNGMVERLHRQLKAALMARLKESTWVRQLPWVLLGLRAATKEDIDCSPAELLYGQQLRLPGQITAADQSTCPSSFVKDLKTAMEGLKPAPTAHHQPSSPPQPHIPDGLQRSTMVWVRRDGQKKPLTPRYDGPYRVLERHGKYFKLRLGDREDTVAIDRLKPANLPEDRAPAEPPKRGRPPAQAPAASPTSSPGLRQQVTTRSGRTVRQPDRYIQCVGGAL